MQLKKYKHDLRISKKAEQLAKEKLAQCKKNLERTTNEFSKYKEEADQRQESLRTEISVLQHQLQKSLAESAELIEKTSIHD